MGTRPQLRFLSIFVPDLTEAAERYAAFLGIEPRTGSGSAPSPHPFAAGEPVVFDLGEVCLALYQCDGRATHPGDVGIGVGVADAGAVASAAAAQGGQVFFGPRPLPGDGREMAVFVMPDRHFFELVTEQEQE